MKGITKKIDNETKEQKEGFLGMLLSISGAILRAIKKMLTGKGLRRAGYENKEEKGVLMSGYGNEMDF